MRPPLVAISALLISSLSSLLTVGCSDSHGMDTQDAGMTGGDQATSSMDQGSPRDWTTCRHVGECQLRPSACCEPCGESNATDYDSVNASFVDVHQMEICPIPQACPRCATFRPNELLPICNEAGRCEVYDVREDDTMVSCSAASECVLIPPTCCDCSGAHIAIRADRVAAYQALVCDPTIDCACEPPEPAGLVAVCSSGRCDAVLPL